jgi:hypothetical protein
MKVFTAIQRYFLWIVTLCPDISFELLDNAVLYRPTVGRNIQKVYVGPILQAYAVDGINFGMLQL